MINPRDWELKLDVIAQALDYTSWVRTLTDDLAKTSDEFDDDRELEEAVSVKLRSRWSEEEFGVLETVNTYDTFARVVTNTLPMSNLPDEFADQFPVSALRAWTSRRLLVMIDY